MMRYLLLACALLLTIPPAGYGQSATVMPVPRAAYYDANGDPCAGCKLYAFETGSNTPLATYQDVNLNTQHAHPIELDSAGRETVFLTNRIYRFRLDTADDVPIWTVDGVGAIPAASGNIDVLATAGEALSLGEAVYLSDGSGSLTAGRWYKGDADQTYSSSNAPVVGFATASISTGAIGTIRTAGRVTGLSGLATGSAYYISATAGGITATEPVNSRGLGTADSSTSLIIQTEPAGGLPSLPDSDQSDELQLQTTSDLTANRFLTFVPGDSDRTITLTGNSTLNQDVSTAGAASFNWPGPCDGRLTATTGVPVTTSDVTGATSVYFTPYQGNGCYVYDGSATWTRLAFAELTLSLSGCTASRPYDVFVYNNAGVLAIESLIWTNATTRATALVATTGRWLKTGQLTRRYVGSVYCNASGGQTDDSLAKRYVFNADSVNRVCRPLRVLETTNSWTYTTATWQQANASATNQIDLMVGLDDATLTARVAAVASNSGGTPGSAQVRVGIGEDSTSAPMTASIGRAEGVGAGIYSEISASVVTLPAVGRHFYAWLEWSVASNSTTWRGDNGGTDDQAGMSGLWCN